VRVEYLQGLGRVGERLVLLLDADKMLSADEAAHAAEIAVDETSPVSEGPRP
jgi:chemotaxis signal transduction protein